MMKNDIKTKLNATEVVVKLIKNWKEAKSVVLFSDAMHRVKATKIKDSDEIKIGFGKPNYIERILYKKFRGSGKKVRLCLIIPEKKSKK